MSKSTLKPRSVKSLTALSERGLVCAHDLPALEKVTETFSVAVSSQMLEQMDLSNPADPIARQFLPSADELNILPIEQSDPIADDAFTTVKGLVHRYPDRCLLMPVSVCPVYCRFCFRRDKLGSDSGSLTPAELEAACAYIQEHREIWEVILTGGDPLILKPASLKAIITKLNAIPHVEVIRIHSRVPVVDSARIDENMIAALKGEKPVYVVLHANHANEFSPQAMQACAALVDAGIPMLSQSTLLKGVNDNIEALSALMRCFIRNRIKPYYLHHGDLARGTSHFRTSIEHGQELMRQLRGRFSGMCQPVYVLDIPGGHGKVPIGPNYLDKCGDCGKDDVRYTIEDYQGNLHSYPAE